MSMRGASRRGSDTTVVSLRSFDWDAATIATLHHPSLPWFDTIALEIVLPAASLATARTLGPRDRLSLLAQFAAHQALLQFAGIADASFEAAEWVIVRKRGSDPRLVRIAARAVDAEAAPPLLTLFQQFAELVGAPDVEALKRPWLRAETLYVEIEARLSRDIGADRTSMRRAAAGEVLSPGAEALRELWIQPDGSHSLPGTRALRAIRMMALLDVSTTVVTIEPAPMQRCGALAGFDRELAGSQKPEPELAEQIASQLARRKTLVIKTAPELLDPASRRVLDTAATLAPATWLDVSAASATLPASRYFAVASRIAALDLLQARAATHPEPLAWLESFIVTDAFERFLQTGALPVDDSAFAALGEPRRSYIAALALLGQTIPRELAQRFLRDLLFDHPLEELIVPGLMLLHGDELRFSSDEIREHCTRHIPQASRPALCRAAAAMSTGPRAACLLMECGDVAEGLKILEGVRWKSAEEVVAALSRVAPAMLTKPLALQLAQALVASARYREARELARELDGADHDLLMAQIERREGDYAGALVRLERMDQRPFRAEMLRGELLRLESRYTESASAFASAAARTPEETIEKAYELAVLAIDSGAAFASGEVPDDHYFGMRLRTYAALAAGDCETAALASGAAIAAARTAIERIDAWLDRIFASFSAGEWESTRALAIEALTAIDEAQGDRGAAGVLYTLAYLAADSGRWETAAHLIERLRDHHASDDAARTFELDLLDAHLEFSRGRFSSAHRIATRILERDSLIAQIREAAALIADEVDWINRRREPLRSTGRSGNRELDDRHRLLQARRGVAPPLRSAFYRELLEWERAACIGPTPLSRTTSEKLALYRSAVANRRAELAAQLAAKLRIEPQGDERPESSDVAMLRTAAVAPYPYADDAFGGVRWWFASRNRLGNWTIEGSEKDPPRELDAIGEEDDVIRCSDRELLMIEGARGWSAESRAALAAIFRTRAENHRLRRLTEPAADSGTTQPGVHGIVGESPAIRAIFELIDRVSRRDVAVCILGESGTGKELVARAIHRASPRRQKPFTAINCAALPENLIESELFGHVRGAFTGADRDRAGLIETSEGGTIFLDEIGEMPLHAQAKLLRFLQDGDFRRVGETANRTADVRVVSATNRKLENAVEEGRFREDLYYRIRGVEMPLPPLRDRGNDVLLLARHFLNAERKRHDAGPSAFSPEAETILRAHKWPGNVRELQNTIRAAHAIAGDTREIELQHLPERLRAAAPSRAAAGSYQDAVTRFRRDLIERSLTAAAGNQNRAADMLNMSRQALAYQIRELGILVRPFRSAE